MGTGTRRRTRRSGCKSWWRKQYLRERAVYLAGELRELAASTSPGTGSAAAEATLASGRAREKFQRICAAQGGMRTPPVATLRQEIRCARAGRVAAIDNRRLARAAKLAGAPACRCTAP